MRLLLLLLLSLTGFTFQAQTFERILGAPNVEERGHCMAQGPNGELYVAGSVGDSAMVMRIDANGDPLWCRTFKPSTAYPCIVISLNISPTGDIVGCGNGKTGGVGYFADGFHFRMDATGSLLWCMRWDDPRPVYSTLLIPQAAGPWFLTGGVYDMTATTFADVITAWVDPSTGLITSISPLLDQFAPIPYIDDIVDAVQANNGYYTTSRISVGGAPAGKFRAFVAYYDGAGVHQWTRTVLHNNVQTARMYGTSIIANNDSLTLLVAGDPAGASTDYKLGLVRMDFQGNIAWAKQFDVIGSAQEMPGSVVALSDGYLISGKNNLNGDDLFLMRVSANGMLQWCRTYGGASNEQFGDLRPDPMIVDASGIWLVGSRITGADRDIYLMRMDSAGNIACGGGSQPVAVVEAAYSNFSQLTTAINTPDAVAFVAVPGAVAYDLPNSCGLSTWLGNDTTACDGLILDAGNPGAQYLWQDGSSAQTFQVSAPGTYWVEVSSGCCITTDTIVVLGGGLPVASFTWTQDAQDPQTVIFTNTSTDADVSIWWADGDTLIQDSLVLTFGEFGHHIVCLVVQNDCGSDTTCVQVDVFPTNVTGGPLGIRGFIAYWADGRLNCMLPDDQLFDVQLLDAMGRSVGAERLNGRGALDAQGLARGVYTVMARSSQGAIWSARCLVPR